jgi:DHA1 family multidrug resistance protein-like MFS transporter
MDVWRKNLYSLWVTQFIAMVGMNLVVPFLPLFIRELGVSDPRELARWSGIAFAGAFASSFLATPFWGTLGDRYGRKPMVVRAIFGLAISQVLIGLSQNVYQVVLFRVVQGAISGFIASALALVSTNTPRERIGYALGLLQSANAGGMVLGPFFGGVLADLIGYREIFFVTAALCAASGVLVVTQVVELQKPNVRSTAASVAANYRTMFTDRRLRVVALALVVGQMSVLMIEPIFALFIEGFRSDTKYVATLAGAIFSVSGLFMVISAPWWGRRNDRLGYRKNLAVAFGVVGLVYIGHALVATLVQLAVLRAFLGFARGGVLPALYSLTSLYSPPDRRGGMMAIASSMTVLGNMLGPTIGGLVAGQFGITATFAVNSCLLLGLSAVIWHTFRDELPSRSATSGTGPAQPPVSEHSSPGDSA